MWWALAAAVVASTTALVIAFGAYPWQRALDREAELQKELRRAHREFIELYNSGSLAALDGGFHDDDELSVKIHSIVDYLEIYGDLKLAKICGDMVENLRGLAMVFGPNDPPAEFSKDEWEKQRAQLLQEGLALRKRYFKAVRSDNAEQFTLLAERAARKYREQKEL